MPCDARTAKRDKTITCDGNQYLSYSGCYPPGVAQGKSADPAGCKADAYEAVPTHLDTERRRTAIKNGKCQYKDCDAWFGRTCKTQAKACDQKTEYEPTTATPYRKRVCTKRSPPCKSHQFPETPPSPTADRGACKARHVVCDTKQYGDKCYNKPAVCGSWQARHALASARLASCPGRVKRLCADLSALCVRVSPRALWAPLLLLQDVRLAPDSTFCDTFETGLSFARGAGCGGGGSLMIERPL